MSRFEPIGKGDQTLSPQRHLGGRVRLEWHRNGLRVGLWLPATQFAGLASRVSQPLPVPVFGDQVGLAATAAVLADIIAQARAPAPARG
jgi:hypothetical protein